MKLYIINSLNLVSIISFVGQVNKVLSFVLIVTAILLNLKKLFENNNNKKSN